MENKVERRCFAVQELRAESEGEKRVIRGHAAVFDSWSVVMGWDFPFRERILPGAFSESLKRGDDVQALFQHDYRLVLGRSTSGTLQLREDDKGLAVEIDLPRTATGDEVLELVNRGDVSHMSFAFEPPGMEDQEWNRKASPAERTLKRLALVDVSPVTRPAYEQTDLVAARRSYDMWAEACSLCGASLEAVIAGIDARGNPKRFCCKCGVGYPLSLAKARLAMV